MFSRRIPADLTPNRLAGVVARLRCEGRALIDLTESNPTRVSLEYPPDLLAPLADRRALTYGPSPLGPIEARRAVAAEYERRHAAIAADRIVLTASTSEAYSLLLKLLADPGDEILAPRPSYPLIPHLCRLEGVVPRFYELEYSGDRWTIDLASVDRAMTDRTRAVFLVSPNNPTGSFTTREELEALAVRCAARGAAIVCDEVFADYDLESGRPRADGSALNGCGTLGFGLGGLSKSVGLPQIKLGWIVVRGPDRLARDALRGLEFICDAFLSVSTPAADAAGELLHRGAGIRAQIQTRIAANARRLETAAASVPCCRALRAEGGWYAVLQVPSYGPEEDLVIDLVERRGVLAHPGYFFDFARESYLVVSLIVAEAAFSEGIARVLGHFDGDGLP